MPTKPTYTIGQTAVLVGKPSKPLPVSTIRSYAVTFADQLSPAANPGHEQERRFDDRGVAVLRLVRELRNERMPIADVKLRLAETTVSANETIALPAPVPTDSTQIPAETPQTAVVPINLVQGLDDRVRRLESTVAAQSWRSVPALAVGAVAGIVVGAGIVLLLVMLLR